MGVHPHAPMKGVQSPCPLCPWGPHAVHSAAERGPDEAQASTRAHPKSRFACAPRRRARRGKEYYPLAEASLRSCQYNASGRSPRKKLRALRLCCGGPVSVRLRLGGRYFRGLPLLPVYRRRGYRSRGYMLPLAGRGYDKQGGEIKSHKDGMPVFSVS